MVATLTSSTSLTTTSELPHPYVFQISFGMLLVLRLGVRICRCKIQNRNSISLF